MKTYLILRDFTGSHNSIDSESFVAGTTRKLSDSLAAALGGTDGGFIKAGEDAKADIDAAPAELADAVLDAISDAESDSSASDVESRETKVTGPDETKPDKKKGKK
jgi:hypothetical protein